MKRFFDFIMSLILFLLLLLPMIVIAIAVSITSKGPILYWSNRIGQNEINFRMPKFRTMIVETPDLPSHLMTNSNQYLSPIGKFLRSYSLDELPQLVSILCGDMSFVGPRPALYNQEDLIALRNERKINTLKPGLTGWAQINGRDELSIIEKVNLDLEYMNNQSFRLDLKIFLATFIKVVKSKDILH